jgi:hypothetical protein
MPYFQQSDPDFWHQAPPSLAAAQAQARAVKHHVAFWTLGEDPDDPESPLALLMDLPPGWVLERHSHDCYRFEVVIRGSMIVDGAVLYAGDVSTSAPGEEYGPHMAGVDGCLTLEMFSRKAGMPAKVHDISPAATAFFAMVGSSDADSEKFAKASEVWNAEQLAKQKRLQALVADREGISIPNS